MTQDPPLSPGRLGLHLRSQGGASRAGSADVAEVSSGARAGKAAAFLLAGFGLAVPFLFIPIVHLITTWLLPVIGASLAWRVWTTEQVISAVDAACPDCGESLGWGERGVRFPVRESCPHCGAQLEIDQA